MPYLTMTAGTRARAAHINANFALALCKDTAGTVSVTHTWTASQTFTGGWTAAASCTVARASSTTPIITATTGVAYPTTLTAASAIIGVVGDTVHARVVAVTGENGIGTTSRFIGATCGGSVSSPSATANDVTIAAFEARGYGTAWSTAGAAAMILAAAENWSGSANGTKIVFQTTPNGSTTAATALTIGQDKSATFAGAVSGVTSLGVSAGAASSIITITTSAGSAQVRFVVAGTKYSWLLAAQENVDNGFEITPSTAVGGTTFSSPVFKVTQAGIGTLAAGLALSGGTGPSNGIQFGTSAPGSLANGQMWYDGTDFKVRTGGATRTITVT